MSPIVPVEEAVWPYPTADDVSHLAIEDVPVLRARIDMLLEERREWRREAGLSVDVHLPRDWRLTPGENRFVSELVRMPANAVATKERLHVAFSGGIEPETSLKIVDVIACKVRKKLLPVLGDDWLETVWGRGYMLKPEVRAQLRG